MTAIGDRLAALPKLPDLPPLSNPKQVAETPIPSWPADATVPQTGSVAEVRNLENPDIREWTLSNGDRVVWLVRDTPDGKIYLSGQSSPGFRNVELGSTLSQVAVQLWAQSGFRFWTQEEFDRWTEAQPGGSRWSYALKANVLDAAVAATPERLPALLERYAQDIAFGTVRPEAVAEFHRLSAASADQGDDYAQLLLASGNPSVRRRH